MNSNRKITILRSYGTVLRVELPSKPVEIWLHNGAGQHSCTGSGNSIEEAFDNLYKRFESMLLAYVDMIEDDC